MAPRNHPQPARAPAPAAQASAQAPNTEVVAPVEGNDVDAASQRALQLRAGGRRSANERVARLEYPKRPGWHQCWINDVPGNIGKMKEIGYDFRIDPVRKERISRVVGAAEGGSGLQAYLMEIPLEIYTEDKKALEAQMNKIDAQIRRGAVDGELKEAGLHVPTEPDGSSRIKMQPVR